MRKCNTKIKNLLSELYRRKEEENKRLSIAIKRITFRIILLKGKKRS